MSDEIEKLREELAEANARRADMRTALEWACEERDRLQRERDEAREELDRYKGEHQYSVGLSMALEQRDEARAEVERLRIDIATSNESFAAGYKDGARDAYRRGAEAMREACAQRVEGEGNGHYGLTGADVAKTLRALPIPEER